MAATDAHRNYVRRAIESGFTNPTEADFSADMAGLKNDILRDLAQYCDLLRRNFVHVHGPNAPGAKLCDRAKAIILRSIR